VSARHLTAEERRIACALRRHSAHPTLIGEIAQVLGPDDPAAFRSAASNWHPWFEDSPAGRDARWRWIEGGQLG
jgi:hypothetical protein